VTLTSAPRFFVPLRLAPAMAGEILELPQDVAHHATRVVRLAVGDSLTLFNGEGGEYAATLTRIDKRAAAVHIDRFENVERESSLAITLAQAIIASDAMDYAIRKATELGVATIQPVKTEHSAAMPGGDRHAKRLAHWREVAISACEQCGRNRIAHIAEAREFADWIATWRGPGIMLVPNAEAKLAAVAASNVPIALLIGPEGGWSSREIRDAAKAGWSTVNLGPRVLRADTAGVAAIAAMQALRGDFR